MLFVATASPIFCSENFWKQCTACRVHSSSLNTFCKHNTVFKPSEGEMYSAPGERNAAPFYELLVAQVYACPYIMIKRVRLLRSLSMPRPQLASIYELSWSSDYGLKIVPSVVFYLTYRRTLFASNMCAVL